VDRRVIVQVQCSDHGIPVMVEEVFLVGSETQPLHHKCFIEGVVLPKWHDAFGVTTTGSGKAEFFVPSFKKINSLKPINPMSQEVRDLDPSNLHCLFANGFGVIGLEFDIERHNILSRVAITVKRQNTDLDHFMY
jgi:hypothetical protein